MVVVNIRQVKRCAFCKYWYDPTNSAIAPQSPAIGLWKIHEPHEKKLCTKKNIPMPATGYCNPHYSCKITD